MTGEQLTGPATWMARAACRGRDPRWWHPDADGWGAHHAYQLARQVCEVCPVRWECLAYAMAVEPATRSLRAGMWGGFTAHERDRLAACWRGVDRCRECGGRYEARWGAWCSDWCRDRGRAALHAGIVEVAG